MEEGHGNMVSWLVDCSLPVKVRLHHFADILDQF